MPLDRCYSASRWAVDRNLPKKPIYDIPGYPSVLAGELIENLMEQAAPFKPGFTLGERAETIDKQAAALLLPPVKARNTMHPLL